MGVKSPNLGGGADHTPTDDSRRAYPRLGAERLMSSVGIVLDLSRGGLRVLAERKPRAESFTITLGSEPPAEFEVDLAWCKKRGRRRFELGLQFKELDQDRAAVLNSICQTYRYRRTM